MLWLERRRIPFVVAVLLVMAGMISILLTVGSLVVTFLKSFIEALPSYQQRIQEQVSSLKALLTEKGFRVTDMIPFEYVNPSATMRLAVGTLGGLGAALSNIVLILLAVTFSANSVPPRETPCFLS